MFGWYRKIQRNTDRKILFPEINKLSGSQEKKDIALYFHIMNDSAWQYLNEWKNDSDMQDWIKRIKSYDLPGCLL